MINSFHQEGADWRDLWEYPAILGKPNVFNKGVYILISEIDSSYLLLDSREIAQSFYTLEIDLTLGDFGSWDTVNRQNPTEKQHMNWPI